MEKIKNYIILGLFLTLGIVLSLKQCSTPKVNKDDSNTVKIVEKWDTINTTYKVVKFKTIYKPKWDTIRDIQPGEITQDSLFYVRSYNDSLTDSNLTIFTKVKVYGVLDGLKVDYRLKVPKYIEHTKETQITKTVIQPSKVSLYIGIEASGSSTSFGISPFIDLNIKRVNIGARYNLLNKEVGIKVGYRLFKSNK